MTVEPVKWLGRCDRCGTPSPEERDSREEAQRDVDECPCLSNCTCNGQWTCCDCTACVGCSECEAGPDGEVAP